jgi:hypothetical protein
MSKQVNIDMYNILKYDFVFINDFNKPLFLQLKNMNCRNKKDIATFINSANCTDINTLSKYLSKYNLDVCITKRYVHFDCGIINTKSTIARKNTIILPKSMMFNDLD